MKRNFKFSIFYILSFFIPFIILTVIFFIKDITPFGSETIMTGDMEWQFVPFINELCQKIKGGESLMYSWCRGMGYDFISEFAYYLASPLNVIFLLFDIKNIPAGISILVILKSCLCGLTMFLYLKFHFHANNTCTQNNIVMLSLSSCYSLCSYFLSYYLLIMWFDCMIMLPLIILSLEYLIHNKKPYLYCIALGFAIFTNYYIGYMICLFVILYFIYYIINEYNYQTTKELLITVKRFIIYSILGGCMSGIILIPEIFALFSTSSAKSVDLSNSLSEIFFNIYSTYFSSIIASPSAYFYEAKTYCGLVVLILVPLYFINKNIKLKKRISMFFLVSFLFLSAHIKLLEYIWNCFHQPNGYTGRNTFILVFTLIIAAYENFINIDYFKLKHYIYVVIFNLFFCLSGINLFESIDSTGILFLSFILIFIYSLIIYLYRRNKKIIFTLFLFIIITVELIINCFNLLKPSITTNIYSNYIDNTLLNIKKINKNKAFRIKNDTKQHQNLGSLCMYSSISTLSSLSTGKLISTMSDMGHYSSLNAINDIGFEPVFLSMLGTKYVISPCRNYSSDIFHSVQDDSYNSYETYIYTNNYYISPAFAVDEKLCELNLSKYDNPFEAVNEISNSIYGCGDVYKKINLDIEENNITIPADTSLYFYCRQTLKNSVYECEDIKIDVYPEILENMTLDSYLYDDNYVYCLPALPSSGKIKCVYNCQSSDIIAYSMNMDNFKQLMNNFYKNRMETINYNDTYINGTINISDNNMVFTSIPYSSGWTVKVDQKKVKTTTCFDSLLSFYVPYGLHTVEFSYVTPGLIPGCIVSGVSFVILLFISFKRRATKNRNEGYNHE